MAEDKSAEFNTYTDVVSAVADKNYVDTEIESVRNRQNRYYSELNHEIDKLQNELQDEKLKQFRSRYGGEWCVRVVNYNPGYHIVVSHIQDRRFEHDSICTILPALGEVLISFDKRVTYLAENEYVITYRVNLISQKGKEVKYYHIKYDDLTHTSTLIDPVRDLIKLDPLLACIGYKLPRRYVNQLCKQKLFGRSARKYIRDVVVLNESDLEQNSI